MNDRTGRRLSRARLGSDSVIEACPNKNRHEQQYLCRKVFLVKASAACLLVVLAASVLLAEGGAFHNAPPFTRTMKNAVRADPAAIRAGRGIYSNYCENCHGVNGRGTAGASKLSTGPTQGASAGEVFWFISNGEPSKGMPSWGHLPARQRWQLVTYLQSLGKTKRLIAGNAK